MLITFVFYCAIWNVVLECVDQCNREYPGDRACKQLKVIGHKSLIPVVSDMEYLIVKCA